MLFNLALHVEGVLAQSRLLGPDVDHAAGCVLAEQGSLWATQYFNLLDVEHFHVLGLYRWHDKVVNSYADLRVLVDNDRRRAYTPHCERRGAEPRLFTRNKVRNLCCNVTQVARHCLFDVPGSQCGNRNRCGLYVSFCAPCRSYHHFLKLRAALCLERQWYQG